MIKRILFGLLCGAMFVGATTLPNVSKFDRRITYAKYNAEDVFLIRAKVGYVSMVKFADDEVIITMSTGFANGWELTDVDNMLFVKPMVYQVISQEQQKIVGSDGREVAMSNIIQPNATDWKTNLIVVTNKRTYTFDLELLEDKVEKVDKKVCIDDRNASSCKVVKVDKPVSVSNDYTLTFAYDNESGAGNKQATKQLEKSVAKTKALNIDEEERLRNQAIREQEAAETREKETKASIDHELNKATIPQNYDYVMHVNKGSDRIAPDFVYDDGLFTYVGFRRMKTIPSFFIYDEDDGEPTEAIVATHLKKYDKFNVIVVHKTFERLILRNGMKVVGIKNNGFAINEVDDLRTTRSAKVKRKVKKEIPMPQNASEKLKAKAKGGLVDNMKAPDIGGVAGEKR